MCIFNELCLEEIIYQDEYVQEIFFKKVVLTNPVTFLKVTHRLCIKAYCNLRKEDRVFAIYRIQKLKIID